MPPSPMPDRERTSRGRTRRTSRFSPLRPAVENLSSVGMQGDFICQQGVQESAHTPVRRRRGYRPATWSCRKLYRPTAGRLPLPSNRSGCRPALPCRHRPPRDARWCRASPVYFIPSDVSFATVGVRYGFLAEDLPDGLAHIGIEVHGVNKIDLRVLLRNGFDGVALMHKPFAKVFATVAGNRHRLLPLCRCAGWYPGFFN